MENKDLELPPPPKSPFRASLEKKEAEFEAAEYSFAHSPVPEGSQTGGYTPFGMRTLHNEDEPITSPSPFVAGIASPPGSGSPSWSKGGTGTMVDDAHSRHTGMDMRAEELVGSSSPTSGGRSRFSRETVQAPTESEIEAEEAKNTQDYNSELGKLLEKSRGTPYEATLKRFIEEKAQRKDRDDRDGSYADSDVGKAGTSIFRSPVSKGPPAKEICVSGDRKNTYKNAPNSTKQRSSTYRSPSKRSAELDVKSACCNTYVYNVSLCMSGNLCVCIHICL